MLVGILLEVILVGFILLIKQQILPYQQQRNTMRTSPTPSLATYHSKFLKITFSYPAKFQLEERFGEIKLENKSGLILIHKTGTNENSIDTFLYEGDSREGNLEKIIVEKRRLKINGLDFVEEILQYPARSDLDSEDYYFYKNNSVYSLSTSFPSLYIDLDQIAQSFHYEP